MSFSRVIERTHAPDREALTQAMVAIGMNFAAAADVAADANIEDTLLYASVEAMERPDFRVLSVLATWLGLHAARVNVDRLAKLVERQESRRVRALWSALGHWLKRGRRYERLENVYKGPRVDLLPTGTDFHVARRGEDSRFVGSRLRVTAAVLRERASDVLSPAELAARSRVYRARLQMGPTYRADMWAALDEDPSLSPSQLARRTYGSFATAWGVCRDYSLLSATRSRDR